MRFSAITTLGWLASSVSATPIFQNKGTSSGWDFTNAEHKGSVQQVSNVYLKGPSALKMTQIFDSNYHDRYHAEVGRRNIYKKGDQGFYGFAFRLQENWEFDDYSYNIAQFITDFSDLKCGEDYMPSSMVWIKGNQLYSRVKVGQVCPTSSQKIVPFDKLAEVTPGVWHTVIIQANWQDNDSGYYKMWFDGQRVLNYSGVTSVGDGRAFEYRVGLYANGWHDTKTGSVSQGTRQIWYDDIAAGSTYADVDPKQWDP